MSAEREPPGEDSIRVVCRFRPLNDAEERAGSKFVAKFPPGNDDQCINLGVSVECFHYQVGRLCRSSLYER